MSVFQMLIVFTRGILTQICAKAKGVCRMVESFLFNRFFYALNTQDTRRFEWRHWTHIKNWGIIMIGVIWLAPLLILNVWYGITMNGCTSVRGRDWLGSFCALSYVNLAVERPPWYVDLWDAQDSITHKVRLPAQDRNLVMGYHHICDAEQYFSYQLEKIDLLPDNLKTVTLHENLSKLRLGLINGGFRSVCYNQTDMILSQIGLLQYHQPYAPGYRLSRIPFALKRISRILRFARSLRATQLSSLDPTACIYPSSIIGLFQ